MTLISSPTDEKMFDVVSLAHKRWESVEFVICAGGDGGGSDLAQLMSITFGFSIGISAEFGRVDIFFSIFELSFRWEMID